MHSQPTNLGNLQHNQNNSLGEEKRRAFGWVSPSPRDLGGDPASQSLGSESASSWHLALQECMTTELELQTTSHMLTSLDAGGQLVLLVDSVNRESLNSFEFGKDLVNHEYVKAKGAKQEDPSIACRVVCRQTKEQTEEQMQLDQARLQEGQL